MSLYKPSFEINFWLKTAMNLDEEETEGYYSFLSCPAVPLDMEFGEDVLNEEIEDEEYYEEGLIEEDNSIDLSNQWQHVIKQLELNKEAKIKKINFSHLRGYVE